MLEQSEPFAAIVAARGNRTQRKSSDCADGNRGKNGEPDLEHWLPPPPPEGIPNRRHPPDTLDAHRLAVKLPN
jgi:hypothetical protein